ncbi:TonB-dependent receptor plug domain-containing protein [Luteimonas mephitis]|uniref:TonB-dependent receptor plug domain-containing protein n=1 Tax=Luteimonas mephitis TaxID=83615 RepID=UPI00042296D7|nr:TonB-dependent receptor [Luteimonas mephitis]
MSRRKTASPTRSRLSTALFAALALPLAGSAFAQDAATTAPDDAKTLDKVVVTGSLIPTSQIETATPVLTITAEDIQARGFNSVTDVLQKSSFATGGIQGAQTSASFTQGAETLSLFGLDPGYVKYLIDGRPMANYPALYNGSSTFNNISGIPVDLVDRIEILPGGQSSLYGSDAIAGVINIILKKRMDGTVLNVRGGWYAHGGGASTRVTLSHGFGSDDGRFNGLFGLQHQERDPIWGYQRDRTKQFNVNGYSAPLASRDYLVFSPFTSYKFMDPANCANVTSGFGGTEGLQTRPGFGDENYCGSMFTPGYRTIMNEKKSTQVYSHATFDINDNAQLYGDVLLNQEKTSYHVGSNFTWWGTSVKWGYFYDPDLDDFLNLQRAFTPEDMGPGGFRNTMSNDKSKSYAVTFGVDGTFGGEWDYDIGFTRTQYDLDETSWVRFAGPMDDYFQDHVLGPQLGLDPYYGAYPVFQPNYGAFYTIMPVEDFRSITGFATSKSKTSDNMLRAQVTNSALFSLPGGDAGIAIALEGGSQKWDYSPAPGFLNGDIWGQTSVAGGGDRTRYAGTAEIRLPVWDMLTVTASGRYDAFKAAGNTVSKPTYSLGLEFRPIDTLLLRGKYGTAFKAPTLSDMFMGESGYYSSVVDYYQCSLAGFGPDAVENCPNQFSSRQFFGTQSGNPDLDPINAKVWSAGAVWSPVERMSISVDYLHWDIDDEVTQQSANALSLQDYRCRTGIDDINSALCQAALSQVTRNAQGFITEIFTQKINVSNETLNAVTLAATYQWDTANLGSFLARSSFTENLKHEYQQYAGDPIIDLINDPYWSSDPVRKADASLSWTKSQFNTTLYANWFAFTPNYAAQITDKGYGGNRAGKGPSHISWNLSLGYNPIPQLQLSFMVNNLFDKMPPMDWSYPGTSGAPYNGNNYDVYGRAYYMEAKYMFGAK